MVISLVHRKADFLDKPANPAEFLHSVKQLTTEDAAIDSILCFQMTGRIIVSRSIPCELQLSC
jgi:hypothetical protein